MPHDDAMDRLLRDAMAADAPQLSPALDARIMRRLRPRGLTPAGRAVIAVYVVAASAAAAWAMRGLQVDWIVAAVLIGVPAAAGAGAYAQRLAARH